LSDLLIVENNFQWNSKANIEATSFDETYNKLCLLCRTTHSFATETTQRKTFEAKSFFVETFSEAMKPNLPSFACYAFWLH
jgi:hypothetical protein